MKRSQKNLTGPRLPPRLGADRGRGPNRRLHGLSPRPILPGMPWMTTEEAARQLGYHPEAIRMMLRSGRLKGKHYGRIWLLDPTSVAEFEAWVAEQGFAKHDPRRGQR